MTKKDIIKNELRELINVPSLTFSKRFDGQEVYDSQISETSYRYTIVSLDKLAEFLAKHIDFKKDKCPHCGK